MSQIILSLTQSKRAYRLAAGSLFFMQGLCFASWASRIPSIQQNLSLTETELGIVLFALPVGSMLALPFSGWLVGRFGSRRVAANALVLYGLLLTLLGFSQSLTQLVLSLALFGMAGNLSNIAINTQAVGVEGLYGRNIMASFHGLWSIAGFTAASIGTVLIGNGVNPATHFIAIAALILAGVAACYRFLLQEEAKKESGGRLFARPDKPILVLGLIAFCCMICEGAMFDWSGIYFQKAVGAEQHLVGAGYTAFMCTMAGGRFIADWVANKIGFKKSIQYSGLLITTGLGIAVIAPQFVPALIGFLLVGFGVSAVVPLVYSAAGRSGNMSASAALTAVSSIGFLGFLIGPPVIGVVAGTWSLRISFTIIALMGLLVSLFSNGLKKS